MSRVTAATLILALLVSACDFNTPLAIGPATLADGAVGVPYSSTITASDDQGSEVISIVVNSGLPPGLALRYDGGNSAEVSGVPTQEGVYLFRVVADGHHMNFGGPHGESLLSIRIR